MFKNLISRMNNAYFCISNPCRASAIPINLPGRGLAQSELVCYMKLKKAKTVFFLVLSFWSPPVSLEPFAFTIHQCLHSLRTFPDGESAQVTAAPSLLELWLQWPTGPTYGHRTMLNVVQGRKLKINLARFWGMCSMFPWQVAF